MFQTHTPTCTHSHYTQPVSRGLLFNELGAAVSSVPRNTVPVYLRIGCLETWGARSHDCCYECGGAVFFFLSFLLLPVYIYFFLLTGEMLHIHRSLQGQIWKLWTPGFSLLDYLWIYFRVPHLLSRLQLWAFLRSKKLLRPRWRHLGPSLQKSSMSARPRWPSWSCGCTKPTWHLSRKH